MRIRDTNWNQWAGKSHGSSWRGECTRCTSMHIRTVNFAARVLRAARAIVSRASTNRARLSHDPHIPVLSAVASRFLRRFLVTYRYPHGAPCHGGVVWTAATRSPRHGGRESPGEKSAINADARGRREGPEVTRKRNIPSSQVRRETSRDAAVGAGAWSMHLDVHHVRAIARNRDGNTMWREKNVRSFLCYRISAFWMKMLRLSQFLLNRCILTCFSTVTREAIIFYYSLINIATRFFFMCEIYSYIYLTV